MSDANDPEVLRHTCYVPGDVPNPVPRDTADSSSTHATHRICKHIAGKCSALPMREDILRRYVYIYIYTINIDFHHRVAEFAQAEDPIGYAPGYAPHI